MKIFFLPAVQRLAPQVEEHNLSIAFTRSPTMEDINLKKMYEATDLPIQICLHTALM